MTKKLMITAFICLFGINMILAAGPQMRAVFSIEGDGPGYELLRTVVKGFGQLGKTHREDIETLKLLLDKWMIQAKKLKRDKKIDAVFFKRFKQLLVVLKLMTVSEPDSVMNEVLVREINKFDIQPFEKDFKVEGIHSVARELTEELLQMQYYLDEKKN